MKYVIELLQCVLKYACNTQTCLAN